jgi:hypothetical protein
MSAAERPAARAAQRDDVNVFRDDGPLARALGRLLGPVVPLPPAVLLLAAGAPLLVVAALRGGNVSLPVAGAVVAWAVVLGGASCGRRGRPKTRWAEPPLLRATEFGGLIWIAALDGAAAYPAAFALLAALTFRHYDLVYRLRHRGGGPGRWLDTLSGGWDGRLLVAFAALLAGALPAGYYVAAAVLGVAFTAEAAAGWLGDGAAGRSLDNAGEEDGA